MACWSYSKVVFYHEFDCESWGWLRGIINHVSILFLKYGKILWDLSDPKSLMVTTTKSDKPWNHQIERKIEDVFCRKEGKLWFSYQVGGFP